MPQDFSQSGGQNLYDFLMGSICPELLSWNLPNLKEVYKDESPLEKEERAERYRDAFHRYEEKLSAFKEGIHSAASASRSAVLAPFKKKAEERDEDVLTNIESQFS